MDGRPHSEHEKQDQQLPGPQVAVPSHHRKDRRGEHHPDLGSDQQPPSIDQIGQDTASESQKKRRQACGCLDKSDQQGGCRQRGHDPSRGHGVHDGAKVGNKVGDPQIAKLGLAEGVDAGSEKLPAHCGMNDRNAPMNPLSHVALAPSTPE